MIKILIASGDSFTHGSRWPTPLSEKLNLELINVAMGSISNGLMSKKLIYAVDQALKKYQPEEILVGIMWGHFQRNEFYIDNLDSVPSENIDGWYENPTNVIYGDENKRWWISNFHWSNNKSKIWRKEFYSNVGCAIDNISNFLFTQWYLEQHKIEYFMTTTTDIYRGYRQTLNDLEVEYLFKMINWDKFIPIKGCNNWLQENYNLESFDGDDITEVGHDVSWCHPNSNGYEIFVYNVIIPYLIEKKIIFETEK